MPREPIDKLISLHFKDRRPSHKLDWLEQDVLRKIHTAQTSSRFSWRGFLGGYEFRMASIAVALLVGVGAGNMMPQGASISREMGLHVFSTQVGYLPSALLEGKK